MPARFPVLAALLALLATPALPQTTSGAVETVAGFAPREAVFSFGLGRTESEAVEQAIRLLENADGLKSEKLLRIDRLVDGSPDPSGAATRPVPPIPPRLAG